MKALPQISEAEFEVMKIVWKYAPINTNEVTERLTRTTDWQPKTIQTLLKRLVNKGALTYEKEGRIFVYTPLVHEKEYVHQKSRAFLDRYYAGNIASMLSAYLEDDTLTQNEIESLRQLLSGKDSEKAPGRRSHMKDYNEEELKDKTEDTTGEKTEEKAVAESQETDDSDYEETCYLCRRPESKTGKLIHLPMNGICVCPDCMERSFKAVTGPNINYDELMQNINMQDIFPPMMGFQDNIPKSQRLKKKKPKEKSEPAIDLKQVMPPHRIKASLDEYIIGQDYAKKVMSVAVYNHYKRVATNMMDEIEIEKSNMLMIGPTGSGKTYLVRTLARLLDVPLAIADATSLTEAGYIGDDIESVVSKLLAAAGNDVEKAERGIIFIDEIDKIAKKKNTMSRDVSGESVQQGLLKLLEGSDVEVPVGASSKNAMVPLTTINTRNILFICGGAFPDLDAIIKSRLNKTSSIGFESALHDANDQNPDIVSQVTIDDLREFGMIPEFIGRLPVIFTLKGLDEEALVKILKEPKNAIIKQYQKLLALDEVDLRFDEGALKAIAKRAIQKKTGARALRSIIEELMLDIMYQIPKDDNIGRVTITEASVEYDFSNAFI